MRWISVLAGIAVLAVLPFVRLPNVSTLPLAVVRGVLILCFALLAGGIAFAPLVLSPPQLAEFRMTFAREQWRVLKIALVVAGLVIPVEYVLSAGTHDFDWLRYAVVWVRYGLLGSLWILLQREHAHSVWIALPGALLLLTRSTLSNAAGQTEWLIAILADWAHFLFSSIWLGGVAMLTLIVIRVLRKPQPPIKELGIAIARFSPIAMFCVFAVALTGLAQSAGLLGNLDALLTTAYGNVLLLKLSLMFVLLGFGAFHQQVISPRLQAWRLRDSIGAATAVQRFRISIVAELTVSVALLAIVGVLVSLPLPPP